MLHGRSMMMMMTMVRHGGAVENKKRTHNTEPGSLESARERECVCVCEMGAKEQMGVERYPALLFCVSNPTNVVVTSESLHIRTNADKEDEREEGKEWFTESPLAKSTVAARHGSSQHIPVHIEKENVREEKWSFSEEEIESLRFKHELLRHDINHSRKE